MVQFTPILGKLYQPME